jgi:hypothetical protein
VRDVDGEGGLAHTGLSGDREDNDRGGEPGGCLLDNGDDPAHQLLPAGEVEDVRRELEQCGVERPCLPQILVDGQVAASDVLPAEGDVSLGGHRAGAGLQGSRGGFEVPHYGLVTTKNA